MRWWKRLRWWHIIGFVVGGTHLVIYMILLYQSSQIHEESGAGYLLLFMEWPFWFLLNIFPLGTIAIIGTLFYALIGMALGWLLSKIIRVTYIFPSETATNQGIKKHFWDESKLWQILGMTFGMIHLVLYVIVVLSFGDKSIDIIRKIEFGLPFSDEDGFMIILGVVGTVLYGSLAMFIGWFLSSRHRRIFSKKREKIQ